MSVSIESMRDLAKMILSHGALDAVVERVHLRLFNRFRKATDDERVIIASIMDGMDLFMKEIRVIQDESETIEN